MGIPLILYIKYIKMKSTWKAGHPPFHTQLSKGGT